MRRTRVFKGKSTTVAAVTALFSVTPAWSADTSDTPISVSAEAQFSNFFQQQGKNEVTVASATPADFKQYAVGSPEYKRVLGECKRQLLKFETQGDNRRSWSIFLALSGAVAGAIIGPAITASGGSTAWTAIASGYSGFTNTAQQSLLTNDFTRQESIGDREKTRAQAVQKLNEYLTFARTPPAPTATAAERSNYVATLGAMLGEAELACTLYELSTTPTPSTDTKPAAGGGTS